MPVGAAPAALLPLPSPDASERPAVLALQSLPPDAPLGPRGQRPIFLGLSLPAQSVALQVPGVVQAPGGVYCSFDQLPAVHRRLRLPPSTQPRIPAMHLPGVDEYRQLGLAAKLRPYQPEMVAFLATRTMALCSDALRSGKTVTAIAAAVARGLGKVLVLCPALAKLVWASEIAKFLDQRALILYGRSALRARWFCLTCRGSGSGPDGRCPDCRTGSVPVRGTPDEIGDDDAVADDEQKWKAQKLAVLDALHEARWVVCFPRGTTVRTPTGEQRIESLHPGDLVTSFDVQARRFVSRQITAISRHVAQELAQLQFASGRVVLCTPEHPFMTENGSWVEAQHAQGTRLGAQGTAQPWSPRPLPFLVEGRQVSGNLLAVDRELGSEWLRPVRLRTPCGQGSSFLIRSHDRTNSTGVSTRSPLPEPSLCKSSTSRTDDPGGKQPTRRRQQEAAVWQDALRVGASVYTREHLREPKREAVSDVSETPRGEVQGRKALRRSVSCQQEQMENREAQSRSGLPCADKSKGQSVENREVQVRSSLPRTAETTMSRVQAEEEIEHDLCVRVNRITVQVEVYNVEVGGTHTFVLGNGLITHNCNFDLLVPQFEHDAAGKRSMRPDLPGWNATLALTKFDGAIADEAHLLRGRPKRDRRGLAKRDRATMVCANIPTVWGLTGTPFFGRVADGYGLLDFLTNGLFGRPFFSYDAAYCGGHMTSARQRGGESTVRYWDNRGYTAANMPELHDRLSVLMWGRPRSEIQPYMPPKTRQVVRIEAGTQPLPVRGSSGIAAALRRTCAVKEPYVVEAVLEELAQGGKTLVYTYLRANAESVAKLLTERAKSREWSGRMKQANLRVWLVHGDQTPEQRFQQAQAFREWNGSAAWVATMDSVPGMISLRGATTVHFLDLHHDPTTMLQAEERGYEEGTGGLTVLYYVVAGSIDEHVVALILPKLEQIEAVVQDRNVGSLRSTFSGAAPEDMARAIWERLLKHLPEVVT